MLLRRNLPAEAFLGRQMNLFCEGRGPTQDIGGRFPKGAGPFHSRPQRSVGRDDPGVFERPLEIGVEG
jgi:hypothetical protein